MSISADTGAIIHSGATGIIDDPAIGLAGWPSGNTAILQSRKVNFTPTTLGTTTKTYTSTLKADITALAAFYSNIGATVDIQEGPAYTITVVLPWDEFSNLDENPLDYTLWEIVPHQIERSMFDVGIFSPSQAGGAISSGRELLNLEQKAAVDYAARNPTYSINLAVKKEWAGKEYLAENYLALKRLQADGIMAFTQTIKRSVIIHSQSDLISDPIDSTGYGNIVIATQDLIDLYNIPADFSPYLLESYSRQKTVDGQDPVLLNALAGWIVKAPTVQRITPGKIQYTQEFSWDEWLDSLYYPYNGDYAAFL